MSLREIKSDGTATVYCVACTKDFDVAPGDVEVGFTLPGNKAKSTDPEPPLSKFPHMMVMPPCPSCSGVTQFQRNFDVAPANVAGSRFDLQRRAVNRYFEKLISLGRKNSDCAAEIDAASTPSDIMALADARALPVAVKRKNRKKA